MARRGGLRGAGGISTASSIAVNRKRGFCPKKRSAAVVPSGRVSRKLWTAVRHVRFLGWSRPRSWWVRSARYSLRPSTLELERWNTSAGIVKLLGIIVSPGNRRYYPDVIATDPPFRRP